jgi:Ca-activated chloride channel family protein
MDQVHRRIDTAVLTGLRLEPAGLRFEPDSVVPARLTDLFAGAPLCVMGRYHGSATGSIALQAMDASGQPWSETVKASSSLLSALPCVWARGHIRELEDRSVLGHPELEKRIVDTSLRFGVLCRFTAFVAIDKSEVANAGGQLHQITQPVEAPEGWVMFGKKPGDIVFDRFVGVTYGVDSVENDTVDSMLRYMAPEQAGGAASASATPTSRGANAWTKLTGRLRRLMRGRRGTLPVPSPDLATYRQRAAALWADLKNVVPADQRARLAVLQAAVGKLAMLIADVESIGASSTELQPLKKLLLQVQKLLAKKAVNEAEVLEVWQKCEQVLCAFAASAPEGEAANTERREGFWK